MVFDDLSPELQERARACKTADELVELANSEGIELTDEALESISGGSWNCNGYCEDNCYKEWVDSMCGKLK